MNIASLLNERPSVLPGSLKRDERTKVRWRLGDTAVDLDEGFDEGLQPPPESRLRAFMLQWARRYGTTKVLQEHAWKDYVEFSKPDAMSFHTFRLWVDGLEGISKQKHGNRLAYSMNAALVVKRMRLNAVRVMRFD